MRKFCKRRYDAQILQNAGTMRSFYKKPAMRSFYKKPVRCAVFGKSRNPDLIFATVSEH